MKNTCSTTVKPSRNKRKSISIQHFLLPDGWAAISADRLSLYFMGMFSLPSGVTYGHKVWVAFLSSYPNWSNCSASCVVVANTSADSFKFNYCHFLFFTFRDATTAGTLVPSSHENYDDISGGIPQPTTEKFAQTDPPSPPEIAYAGEYPDQEPLTLLPTYTSPEYTNDLLILRL